MIPTPIRDSYWVTDGQFLAGEYPGAPDSTRARKKLEAFIRCGIRTFIDLTEERDGLEPYDLALTELAQQEGLELRYRRHGVRDMGLPADGVMSAVLRLIASEIAEGRPVYVHCWGGIGRTGTVVGGWLVEQGMPPGDALVRIATLRARVADRDVPSPQTGQQCDFVRAWRPGSLQVMKQ